LDGAKIEPLRVGGKVTLAPVEPFYSVFHAAVTDRFGVNWNVVAEEAPRKLLEENQMKIAAISIQPQTEVREIQCAINKIDFSERANQIKDWILSNNLDMVFCTESSKDTLCNVVNRLTSYGYKAIPDIQGLLHKDDSYNSARIVAITKLKLNAKVEDSPQSLKSKGYAYGDGIKWLCVSTNDHKILCVHFPSSAKSPDDWDFMNNEVNDFAQKVKPDIIIGDFNYKAEHTIEGYRDVLGSEITSAFKTKIDYCFVRNSIEILSFGQDNKPRLPHSISLFSDHSTIWVEYDMEHNGDGSFVSQIECLCRILQIQQENQDKNAARAFTTR
jgi:hypothetical protein